MARLITHGWESGNLYEQGSINNIQSNPATPPALLSSGARSGNYAASFQINLYGNSAIGHGEWVSLPINGNPSEIYIRVGVRVITPTGYGKYLVMIRDGGTNQVTLDVTTGGTFEARCGSTVLGRGGVATTNAWTCIEIRIKVDPSAGIMQVWQDGVLIISFTGNTRSSAASQINAVLLGWMNTISTNETSIVALDDIAINDTTGTVNNGRIGQGGIYPLFPIADTPDKDFARSGGADNYILVNSIMADDEATYVQDGLVGDRDLYSIQSLSGGSGSIIDVVTVIAKARAAGGTGVRIGLTTLTGSSVAIGSMEQLVNAYGYKLQAWEREPSGVSSWTIGAVQSLQIGVTIL